MIVTLFAILRETSAFLTPAHHQVHHSARIGSQKAALSTAETFSHSLAPPYANQPLRLANPLPPLIQSPFSGFIKKEAKLAYSIVKSNLLSTVVLGTACTVSFGFASSLQGIVPWMQLLTRSTIWFLLYAYQFDIEHQLCSIDEDRLNAKEVALKRDRPLVTGELSEKGALLFVHAL